MKMAKMNMKISRFINSPQPGQTGIGQMSLNDFIPTFTLNYIQHAKLQPFFQ
jgi:hypothetical protein